MFVYPNNVVFFTYLCKGNDFFLFNKMIDYFFMMLPL